MAGMMTQRGNVRVPDGVRSLDAFCRWRETADLPENLPVHFINGEVWVDVMEEMFSHNRLKTALGISLGQLIEGDDLGMYVTDGMLLTNTEAQLGTEPDAMFLSNESLAAKRVTFTAGKRRGARATRVVGTPDLVVEIISPHTADKGTEWLMSAYHNAGIPEYWLIDARTDDDLRFDIYKRGTRGYTASRKSDGWVKSVVLSKQFRLTRSEGKSGYVRFTLEAR
jgi:Uma2 family endonuclease